MLAYKVEYNSTETIVGLIKSNISSGGYSWYLYSGSGSSSYKTYVEAYTSHTNYYILSSTNWNAPSGVTIDSSSNVSITITYDL